MMNALNLPQLIAVGLLTFCLGCTFPKDPAKTLQRVQGGVLRVGVTAEEPWTIVERGEVSGMEADLVRQWAQKLGAVVQWKVGSEGELLEAVEQFELDLYIGGLTDDTLWKSRLGLTRPYITTRVLIASSGRTLDTEGDTKPAVAVEIGDPIATRLKHKGYNPNYVEQIRPEHALLVADDWLADAWGMVKSHEVLQKENHVMAVPPGENGFLRDLDTFLQSKETEIRDLLKKYSLR